MANTPNPGTGAGGLTGPPGAPQPTKPVRTIPAAGKVKGRVWNDSQQGKHLNDSYESLVKTFTHTMPGQRAQFLALAAKRFGG